MVLNYITVTHELCQWACIIAGAYLLESKGWKAGTNKLCIEWLSDCTRINFVSVLKCCHGRSPRFHMSLYTESSQWDAALFLTII